MTEEKGKAGHGRKAWRSKGLATDSSAAGELSPHMLKRESSLSEEPAFYLETCKLKGSMKCHLKPEGQSSKTGKSNTNPKMGQDN